MKSKDTIKKLEFKKETIARLGEGQMQDVQGGQGTQTGVRTRQQGTCTCIYEPMYIN